MILFAKMLHKKDFLTKIIEKAVYMRYNKQNKCARG